MKEQSFTMVKMGLRVKVILSMVAALALIMIVVFVFVSQNVTEQLKTSFESRGAVLTKTLAGESTVHLFYEQKDEQLKRIREMMDDYQDVEYIIVLSRAQKGEVGVAGSPYKFMVAHQRQAGSVEKLLAQHKLSEISAPQEFEGVLAFTEPVYPGLTAMFDFSGKEEGPALDDALDEDGLLDGAGEEEKDGESKDGGSAKEGGGAAAASPGKKPGDTGAQEVLGYICLGISTAELDEQKNDTLQFLAGIFSLALLLFGGMITLASNRLIQRLLSIMDAARRISKGDLTEIIRDDTKDEIGMLASALNQISFNLNDIMSAISKVSDSLVDAVEQITSSTEEVAQGAEHQVASVDETSSSMSEMLISLKGIAENVEILASSAEESSSSILEMAATNDEMADNIHSLATSVEQTTSSIGQMTQTIKEVAANVEDLSSAADETSASMRQMDVTIGQVEANANQTADLSDEVRQDAERGSEAVKLTKQGISRISESTQDAFQVMGALGKKVQAIGQVLTVIDDVAEQTNLLALNAAIIAAQAGEHGKGFAVVADEIKDLAERTAASTSEIANLIQAVQSETRNVNDAMQGGLKSVEEGVKLSNEAEAALKQILDSSTKSTRMMREIARATVEQARGSKEVTSSIQRIAETVQQIAMATAQQAKGSEQIMNSAERMRVITQHVHGSSQEQARGSKQITRAIENISEMVNHLNRAQREQARGAEQVMSAVERIKEIAERHSQSMGSMKFTVDNVAKQADTLRNQISQLKL